MDKPCLKITATRVDEDTVHLRFCKMDDCFNGGPAPILLGDGTRFPLDLYRAFVSALTTGTMAVGGIGLSIDERDFALYDRR